MNSFRLTSWLSTLMAMFMLDIFIFLWMLIFAFVMENVSWLVAAVLTP